MTEDRNKGRGAEGTEAQGTEAQGTEAQGTARSSFRGFEFRPSNFPRAFRLLPLSLLPFLPSFACISDHYHRSPVVALLPDGTLVWDGGEDFDHGRVFSSEKLNSAQVRTALGASANFGQLDSGVDPALAAIAQGITAGIMAGITGRLLPLPSSPSASLPFASIPSAPVPSAPVPSPAKGPR